MYFSYFINEDHCTCKCKCMVMSNSYLKCSGHKYYFEGEDGDCCGVHRVGQSVELRRGS